MGCEVVIVGASFDIAVFAVHRRCFRPMSFIFPESISRPCHIRHNSKWLSGLSTTLSFVVEVCGFESEYAMFWIQGFFSEYREGSN